MLLSVLFAGDRQAQRLGLCSYFQFVGTERQIWDPTLMARLAYEGFFTITTGRSRVIEPLPELQPFYGVLTWPNFEASKHVRQALTRLRRSDKQYRLVNGRDPMRSWKSIDEYHRKSHGTNWLTQKYFAMNRLASADKSVNFTFHCIELYASDEAGSIKDDAEPLAGEMGFSIGRVYTSLSGWTAERTPEGLGTAQLVLLGRWLQQKGYTFWSLGHCYSPEMEYKRQLGHRVYPREAFLRFLRQHRGKFRPQAEGDVGGDGEGFVHIADGESVAACDLLERP